MFKHYLTYQLALSFHQTCLTLRNLEPLVRERLMRSSETAIHHFASALHATHPKDESRHLFVSLMCVRDCREILEEAGIWEGDVTGQYEVLNGRMEKLCERAAEAEKGQFRLLG